jgi:hypothetical protein
MEMVEERRAPATRAAVISSPTQDHTCILTLFVKGSCEIQ